MGDAYKAHDLLKKYYNYLLLHSKEGDRAIQYLSRRGIKEDTIKKFDLGFAPFKASPTLQFLKSKGFSFRTLEKAKILYRFNNGNLTDPFKGRIIFPIQDYYDRTVAFGGRTLDEKIKVKYLNSPDTRIFKKGDNLFGFNLAKKEIESQGYAILFEGYFDVIMAYQEGVKNTIATLGTALTVNQALLIKNVTKNVVIAFDGDAAGMDNSFRSASVLKSVGCNVKISHIKNNLDPADFIKKYGGNDFIKEIIAPAKDISESYIDYKKKDFDLTCSTDRFSYVLTIIDELSSNNINEQKQLLKTLEAKLNVSLKTIYEVIERRTT